MAVEGRLVVLRDSPIGSRYGSTVAGVTATGSETVTVRPGAMLEANCTMSESLPAATLSWLLNGVLLNVSEISEERESLSGLPLLGSGPGQVMGRGNGGDGYEYLPSNTFESQSYGQGAGIESGPPAQPATARAVRVSNAVTQRGRLQMPTSVIRLPAALFDKRDRLTCVAAHPSLAAPSSASVDLFILSTHE